MLRHRPGADSLDGRRIAAEGAEPDVRLSLNETSSQHRVRIPIVAGASGGGVCATILGLLSRRKCPHYGEL